MKRFSPAVVPVLALLVAVQALAAGGSWLVCRYTGEVMASCECQRGSSAADGAPTVEDEDCCLLVRSEAAAVPAIIKASATTAPTIVAQVCLPPVPSEQLSLVAVARDLVSGRRRPRSTPLYVQVRSLLI